MFGVALIQSAFCILFFGDFMDIGQITTLVAVVGSTAVTLYIGKKQIESTKVQALAPIRAARLNLLLDNIALYSQLIGRFLAEREVPEGFRECFFSIMMKTPTQNPYYEDLTALLVVLYDHVNTCFSKGDDEKIMETLSMFGAVGCLLGTSEDIVVESGVYPDKSKPNRKMLAYRKEAEGLYKIYRV